MRTVITGASGFVGRQLIELLVAEGQDLLLVGRDTAALTRDWPHLSNCAYSELSTRAHGFDQVVHLAVLNNNIEADEATFFRVNVGLTLEVLRSAQAAGIARFINVSSMHALDDSPHPYARSKRAAVAAIHAETGIDCITVYMPAVYGDVWAGKLAVLNRLPAPLARSLFAVLAAIKPTVHISSLAEICCRKKLQPGTVLLADDQNLNPVYRFGKRSMDLGFALAVLLLFWWAMIAVWLAVRLQSPGPGIFAQERVGRHGRPFICYKFRSMHVGTAQVGTHQVAQSAVTPIGNFLRRTKIDELPQIFNIFRNEISLVGPRPCLTVQTELVAERQARGVLDITPGITGLAQINDIDMSRPVRLAEWDARYVATRSLLLDIKILLRTALGGGQGDKIRQGEAPR